MSAPWPADGRRRRSVDSRSRLVGAMLELVAEGHPSPGAEQVAARAGIGLRSVFRHFKDMDSLYDELSAIIAERLDAMARMPLQATAWRGQMHEILARRIAAFEALAPFLHAGQLHRHRSPSLRADHARFVGDLRVLLARVLPGGRADDKVLVEALVLLLSFEAWRRLRDEQGLGADAAEAVLARALESLISPAG